MGVLRGTNLGEISLLSRLLTGGPVKIILQEDRVMHVHSLHRGVFSHESRAERRNNSDWENLDWLAGFSMKGGGGGGWRG